MMFLAVDRERMERIEKNLLSLFTGVSFRTDLGLLVKKLDAIAESQGNTVQQIREELGTRQEFTFAVLQRIEESQGKLLEAISGLRESGMRNHQQIRAEFKAVQRKKGPRR